MLNQANGAKGEEEQNTVKEEEAAVTEGSGLL